MSNLACFGFWTCAAVYVAIGVIGVFFLSTQPNIASSTGRLRHDSAGGAEIMRCRAIRDRRIYARGARTRRNRLVPALTGSPSSSGTASFATRMKSTATSAVMSATV